MKLRNFLYTALALLGGTLLGIFVLDRPLAVWLHRYTGSVGEAGGAVTTGFETIFASGLSSHFALYMLLAVALVLHLRDRSLRRARGLYFVAATAYLTRKLVGLGKEIFERVRPYDYIAGEHPPELDFFVSGAHSFPSGHSAWYFGALFPAALLLPRWRWPLLALASLGALARVLEGQHYLSDILASALVALCVTLALQQLMRVRPLSGTPGA